MNEAILTALITGILSFAGVLVAGTRSQRELGRQTAAQLDKAQALTEQRLTRLEAKMDEHNRLIERTYRLEERMSVIEEALRGKRNDTE